MYTPWAVTWLLIYQRLHGNATLGDAVAEFAQRLAPVLRPAAKRVRDRTVSGNTAAYSRARSALDPAVTRRAADRIYDSLVDTYPPSWRGRRAFILDGTTIPRAPTPALRAAYPPATNPHGSSHGPILHLAVAHELASGLAVTPEYGPMYGPAADSELALATRLVDRRPGGAVLLADRNFGVFAFAHAATGRGHDVVTRLTEPRFRALVRAGTAVRDGVWRVDWVPSRWDRTAHPGLPAGAVIRAWVHEVRASDRLTLWLVTTMDATGAELAALYHRRQDVETDIRDLKGTLERDALRGKGVDMVGKEVAAGMAAYNLANQVRRLAAGRAGVEPRRLSFAGVGGVLKAFVAVLGAGADEAAAEAAFDHALQLAGQRKLPNRTPGRAYPRSVIPRRRKFPERKRPVKAVAERT